ncbi:MAG: hypothetical protein P8X89_24720, partial [Reinekea sp.]
ELSKQSDSYDAVKEAIAQDPALAAALQNPDLTPEQKETMLNGVTQAVMVKLGYDSYDTALIDSTETGHNGQQVAGYYDDNTDTAYVNDRYNNSTEDLISTTGHETSHAMDSQDGVDNGEGYAQHYGDNLASYTDQALDINGYDDGIMKPAHCLRRIMRNLPGWIRVMGMTSSSANRWPMPCRNTQPVTTKPAKMMC